jgi:hypothetical protein
MLVCHQDFRTLPEFPDALFADGVPTLHDLALLTVLPDRAETKACFHRMVLS